MIVDQVEHDATLLAGGEHPPARPPTNTEPGSPAAPVHRISDRQISLQIALVPALDEGTAALTPAK